MLKIPFFETTKMLEDTFAAKKLSVTARAVFFAFIPEHSHRSGSLIGGAR